MSLKAKHRLFTPMVSLTLRSGVGVTENQFQVSLSNLLVGDPEQATSELVP